MHFILLLATLARDEYMLLIGFRHSILGPVSCVFKLPETTPSHPNLTKNPPFSLKSKWLISAGPPVWGLGAVLISVKWMIEVRLNTNHNPH